MNESIFDKLDFGPLKPLLDNDDITDISYCNGGQIWVRSLTQGSIRVEIPGCTQEFMEKLAFQCSNVMGTTFNNAKPFLDAESSELRLNFVHDSIATNGIACVIRKTPAKIRLEKEKLLKEDYFTVDIHDLLIKCVEGHCNVIVAGETGSGKTEFVKYLASHTRQTEKIITIEDTLELHLDRIFPQRDIVAMKTNNVASYTDVLVTCMRQNPKWILLSEVRSAEAVTAVRNSISSGHNILSTIHADKASAIPYRLYSLMETDIDVEQFLTTIYRYIQLGVHIKAYYSKEYGKFHREVDEVVEFYVDDDNVPRSHTIYRKIYGQEPIITKPSAHLIEYLENQNIDITNIVDHIPEDEKNFLNQEKSKDEKRKVSSEDNQDSQTNNNTSTGKSDVNYFDLYAPKKLENQNNTQVQLQEENQQIETSPVIQVEESDDDDSDSVDFYFGGGVSQEETENTIPQEVTQVSLNNNVSSSNSGYFNQFAPKPVTGEVQREQANLVTPSIVGSNQSPNSSSINEISLPVANETNIAKNVTDVVNPNIVNPINQAPLTPDVANFFQNTNNVNDVNQTSTSINDLVFNSSPNNNPNT